MSGERSKVLLIGRGGREHALAVALARSPSVTKLYVVPGNGGTAAMGGKTENIALLEDDFAGQIVFAREHGVGLVVAGPDAVIALGAADAFTAAGIACFAPTKAAARLEWSKAFAKDFMTRHGIPTARYAVFRDLDLALAYVRRTDHPIVLKASGLAAGKGVVLPETVPEAESLLNDIMLGGMFGAAGEEVVIEERLSGPEASIHAFCDGKSFRTFPVGQDHKRVLDGDRGANTGGMGVYAPAPVVSPALLAVIEQTVITPVLKGMAIEGTPFIGLLYPGLMLTPHGPRVIEFNCRFGDPETQAMLPLLKSDLAAIFIDCIEGKLGRTEPQWRGGSAVTVVAASGGYPGGFRKGIEIKGLEAAAALPETTVFHAGTTRDAAGRLVTDGGRVLSVTGTGATFAEARARAYAGIEKISFEGMHYRRDIGVQAP